MKQSKPFSMGVMLAAGFLLALAVMLLPGQAAAHPSENVWTPQDTTTVSVDPESQAVDVGEEFTINVMISDVVDLGAFEFVLEYNPAVVNALDIVLGDFLGSTGRTVVALPVVIDNENGTATFGAFTFGDPAGPDGAGLLATVTLSGMADGVSSLTLAEVIVTDTAGTEITPLLTQDGTVTVGSGAQTWFEEDDPAIIYSDLWKSLTCVNCSGDALAVTPKAGETAEFTFEGTGIRWILARGRAMGKARIYMDGEFVRLLDLYASESKFQEVWQMTDLEPGTHTILLEATGWGNPRTKKTYINIDAFEVLP